MAEPFLSEIRIMSFVFPPKGWALCDGQLLPINQNQPLFALLGTTFGGDGRVNFALPDLRSRVPIHVGPAFALGQTGGAETVTLTTSQIPAHSHVPQCQSGTGNLGDPTGGVWAQPGTGTDYSNAAPSLIMDPAAIGPAGGSQPHDNMVPFLVINFILSLFGIFPSQT